MGRVFGFSRRHPVLVISFVVALVAVSGSAVWATTYDNRTSNTLLPGSTIETVPVGGLSYDEAVARVRDKVEAPLHRQMEVTAADHEVTTTPWDLGLRVDVPSVVRKAMDDSQDGNLLVRVWRRVTGNSAITATATPEWGEGDLNRILETVAEEVKVEPKNANIDTSSGFVSISQPQDGRALDAEGARKAILDGVNAGQSAVTLPVTTLKPERGADAYAKVILVRAGENKLYLYENGSLSRTWGVATGTADHPTPTGMWRVVSKLVNPTWVNPGSAWAKSMPKTIPPGPNNPLGTRALALNASGILIHATPDVSSIGYSASHGCIRMTPSDELELFNMVPVGTPVAIVKAGPPKPRPAKGAAPVAPPPEADAAQNF